MVSKIPENGHRLFTISYHLADDTISVFEVPCRNFGFVAGEFFGKSKFYLPGQGKYISDRPVAYRSQDFYLGATVILRDFCFHIITADQFALKFMEEHKEQVINFIFSINSLLAKNKLSTVSNVTRCNYTHKGSR